MTEQSMQPSARQDRMTSLVLSTESFNDIAVIQAYLASQQGNASRVSQSQAIRYALRIMAIRLRRLADGESALEG